MRRLLAFALLSATALPLARVADAQSQFVGCRYNQGHPGYTCLVDIRMDTHNQTYNMTVYCPGDNHFDYVTNVGYTQNPCGNNPTEAVEAP